MNNRASSARVARQPPRPSGVSGRSSALHIGKSQPARPTHHVVIDFVVTAQHGKHALRHFQPAREFSPHDALNKVVQRAAGGGIQRHFLPFNRDLGQRRPGLEGVVDNIGHGLGNGAPGDQPGNARKKNRPHRSRCLSARVSQDSAACNAVVAPALRRLSAAASQALPSGQIRSAWPQLPASGAAR